MRGKRGRGARAKMKVCYKEKSNFGMTRETIRESSPAINLVFSKVSGDFNNKIQQLMFPLKIIKSQSVFMR